MTNVTTNVTTNVVYDPQTGTTVADAYVVLSDRIVRATGSARTHEPDTPNYETGSSLALGRALRSLGRQLIHDSFQTVSRRDSEREHQEQASLESKKRKAEKVYKFQLEFAKLIELENPGIFRTGNVRVDSNKDIRVNYSDDSYNKKFLENLKETNRKIRENLPG